MFNKSRTRVFNLKILYHLMQGILLIALPMSLKAATPPAQEFWDYMSDLSDENGEVIDPLDIDQALNLRGDTDVDTSTTNQTENPPSDKARNKSSVTASSKAMNGAKL